MMYACVHTETPVTVSQMGLGTGLT